MQDIYCLCTVFLTGSTKSGTKSFETDTREEPFKSIQNRCSVDVSMF